MKPYVIEITTFQYKSNVDADKFWARDAKIESDYTSKQSGFISRESGYSDNTNEVVVVCFFVKIHKIFDFDLSGTKNQQPIT